MNTHMRISILVETARARAALRDLKRDLASATSGPEVAAATTRSQSQINSALAAGGKQRLALIRKNAQAEFNLEQKHFADRFKQAQAHAQKELRMLFAASRARVVAKEAEFTGTMTEEGARQQALQEMRHEFYAQVLAENKAFIQKQLSDGLEQYQAEAAALDRHLSQQKLKQNEGLAEMLAQRKISYEAELAAALEQAKELEAINKRIQQFQLRHYAKLAAQQAEHNAKTQGVNENFQRIRMQQAAEAEAELAGINENFQRVRARQEAERLAEIAAINENFQRVRARQETEAETELAGINENFQRVRAQQEAERLAEIAAINENFHRVRMRQEVEHAAELMAINERLQRFLVQQERQREANRGDRDLLRVQYAREASAQIERIRLNELATKNTLLTEEVRAQAAANADRIRHELEMNGILTELRVQEAIANDELLSKQVRARAQKVADELRVEAAGKETLHTLNAAEAAAQAAHLDAMRAARMADFDTAAADVSRHHKDLVARERRFMRQLEQAQRFDITNDNLIGPGFDRRGIAAALRAGDNAVLQLGATREGVDFLNDAVQRNATAARIAAASTNALGERWIGAGRNAQWLARQVEFRLTLPMLALGAIASALFIDFDKQFAQFAKVLNDDAAIPLADFEKQFKSLSLVTGQGLDSITDAAAQFAQAGFRDNALLNSLTEAARLSILSRQDIAEATTNVIRVQRAWRFDSQEMAKAINLLNAVENNSAISIEQLIEAMVRVGGTAQAAGVGFGELALLISAIVPAFGNATQAGTALRTIFTRLGAPTGAAAERLQELGFALSDFNALNAFDQLVQLSAALNNIPQADQDSFLRDIFGLRQGNRALGIIQDIQRALDGLGSTVSDINRLGTTLGIDSDILEERFFGDAVANAQTAAQEIDTLLSSPSSQFQIALNALKIELIDLGRVVLPVFTLMIKLAGDLFRGFMNLDEGVRNNILLWLGLAAVAVSLIGILSAMAIAVGAIIKGFGLLKDRAALAAEAAGALNGGYILLFRTIAARMVLMAGFVLLLKDLGQYMPQLAVAFTRTFEVIAKVVTTTAEIITTAIFGVIDVFSWMLSLITGGAIQPTRFVIGRESGGTVPGYEAGTDMVPVRKIGNGFMTEGISAVVGEGRSAFPEYVIPTDPKYRGNAELLTRKLLGDIGMAPGYETGGIIGSQVREQVRLSQDELDVFIEMTAEIRAEIDEESLLEQRNALEEVLRSTYQDTFVPFAPGEIPPLEVGPPNFANWEWPSIDPPEWGPLPPVEVDTEEIARVVIANPAVEETLQQFDALADTVFALTQQLEAIEPALDAQAAAVEHWEDRLDGVNDRLEEAQDHLQALRDAASEVQAAIDFEQSNIDQLADAPLAGMGAYEDQIFANEMAMAELNLEIAKIEQASQGVAGAQADLDALSSTLDDLNESAASIRDDIAASESAIQDFASAPIEGMGVLEDAIFANQMAQKELRLEMLQIEQAQGPIEDVQQRLAALAGDIEKLRARRTDLRLAGAGSDILAVLDTQIDELEQARRALVDNDASTELDALQAQLDALGIEGQMLQLEYDIDFDPLRREIDELVNDVPELTFDAIITGIAEEQQRLDILNESLSSIEQQIADTEALRDIAQERVDAEKEVLDALQAQVDALRLENEVLNLEFSVEFDPLVRQIQDLVTAQEELTFEEIISGIQESQAEIGRLTPELEALNEQIAQAENTVISIEIERDNVQDILDAEREILREIEEDYRDIEAAIRDAESALGEFSAASIGDALDVGDIDSILEEVAIDAATEQALRDLDEAFGSFGDRLGGLQETIDELKKAFGPLNDIIGNKAVQDLLKLIAAIWGLRKVIGAAKWLTGLVWGLRSLSLIGPAISFLSALGTGIAAALGGISLAAVGAGAAVGVLAAGLVYFFGFTDTGRAVVGWLVDNFWNLIRVLGTALGPVGLITQAFLLAWDAVNWLLGGLGGIGDIAGSIVGWFGDIGSAIGGIFGGGFDLPGFAAITGGLTGLQTVAEGVWNFFKGDFWRFFTDTLPNTIGRIWDGLEAIWRGVWSGVTTMLGTPLGWLKDTFEFGINVVGTVVEGAFDGVQAVWDVIWGIGSGAMSGLSSALGWIENTFKLGIETAGGTVSAVWSGVQAAWDLVWGIGSGIRGVLEDVLSWIKGTFTVGLQGATTIVGNVFSHVGNFFAGAWNLAGRVLASAVNGVTWVIEKMIDALAFVIPGWDGWDRPILSFGSVSAEPIYFYETGGIMAGVGAGFIANQATAIVGEGRGNHNEYVIPTDPRYRGNAMNLFANLAMELGVPGYAMGGIISFPDIPNPVDDIIDAIDKGIDIGVGLGKAGLIKAVRTQGDIARTGIGAQMEVAKAIAPGNKLSDPLVDGAGNIGKNAVSAIENWIVGIVRGTNGGGGGGEVLIDMLPPGSLDGMSFEEILALEVALRGIYDAYTGVMNLLNFEFPGFRDGGIGNFGSGTLAMLHGREMVAPLPNNFDLADLARGGDTYIDETNTHNEEKHYHIEKLVLPNIRDNDGAQKLLDEMEALVGNR